MNIKDMYLHGGNNIVKNITFSIPSSGTNSGKLVATITWAKEGAETTTTAIPINTSIFGSVTKNTVLAGPNGSNGNPSFRALVAADIPDLAASKIASGVFDAARLPLASNSVKGAIILGVALTSDLDSAITDKKYWVKMNANGKLFVDIPWTDHTYTVNNATFSIKSKIGTNNAVTLSDFTANQSAADDFTLILGPNITFTNDATNRTLTIAGTPNTTYKLTLNGTVKGTTGGTDLGTFYAIATSDTTTANQVWMRNANNNGYGWRTLGSRAFDSTAYIPKITYEYNKEISFGSSGKLLIGKFPCYDSNVTIDIDATTNLTYHATAILATQNINDSHGGLINFLVYGDASNTIAPNLYLYYPTNSRYIEIYFSPNKFSKNLIHIRCVALNAAPTNICENIESIPDTATIKPSNMLTANFLKLSGGTVTGDITATTFIGNLTGTASTATNMAYTGLTGSSTTADQAIVSSGTANGWTLKTLGSRAFDSTAYLPLTGGTVTGAVVIKKDLGGNLSEWILKQHGGPFEVGRNSNTMRVTIGVTDDNYGFIQCKGNGITSSGKLVLLPAGGNDTLYFSRGLYLVAHAGNITDKAATITSSSTTLATIAGKNITAKLPTNAKDTAGIVSGPGAAGKVYISDSSGAPIWDTYDTTVTSGSSHLVTSGAVYTAIANNVASAVQYQGTITSEADMIALTDAGKGDFARVTTEFTFTDASGASVKAHVGDVVYLTNDTPGTAANWIVAHTEIDTNTWTAASTSAAGYVPKLATGGDNLAAASTDYVLAFTNGATSPSWLKLPASAYKNDNTTGIKLKTSTGAPGSAKKTDTTLISAASSTGLQIQGGTNKFLIGDGTNYIEVGVAHGLSTKNININGTNYALYTSASSLPTIKAPTAFGSANLILATNADANGLTWVDKPVTNVTTSLYVGASNGTSTAAQTAGNVHLILKEGSSYTRYKITGSGRASVTSDTSGTITINSAGYSNFVKSGSNAAAGLVPSPGATEGTGKFLCEDGTWKTPSYTTNTDENVKQSETTTTNYRGVVLGYNTNAAANTGVSGTVTEQVYISNNLTVQPYTGNVVSLGRGTFAGLTSSSGDLIFNAVNHILWTSGSVHQRIFLTDDATADTAVFIFQLSSDSGSNWSNLMTIKDNGKVVATTFVGALSGNATTATNLKETNMRGWLYQDGDASTNGTGVGTRSTTGDNSIGIPIIHHISSSNDTYVLMKTLFRKTLADSVAASSIYIGDSIRSNKFACIKSKDSTTDDWNGSSTSGSSGSGSTTTYTAGDGISINSGVISTTRKEWYGTEAQFNALPSLDNNTTYYITTT